MKKAKIMLSILTVLTVAGGILAVRASKFNNIRYYTTDNFNDVPPASNTFIGKTVATGTSVYYTNLFGAHATSYAPVAVDGFN